MRSDVQVYPKENGEDALRFIEEVYRYAGKAPSLRYRILKFRAMLALEISQVHFGLLLANFLMTALPRIVSRRLRPIVYRSLGMRIGHGTIIPTPCSVRAMGRPYKRLTFGDQCSINGTRFFLNASVNIGNAVTISEGCLVSTDRHEVGPPEQRFGRIHSHPLTIGDGVWIQRNAMIMAVNIGRGAIVGAGAVVTKDVPPNVFVAGVPARVVRSLPLADEVA
jgi:maltose O-acetyltransferase